MIEEVALNSPEAMAAFITAGSVILVGLFAVVGYPFQKYFDRREAKREQAAQAASEVLEAIALLAAAHMKNANLDEAQTRYAVARMKFSAFASDEVAKQLGKLGLYFSQQVPGSAEDINLAVAALLRGIRRQTRGSTSLTNRELLSLTPFTPTIREK